jgi:chromosome segregation ATPase
MAQLEVRIGQLNVEKQEQVDEIRALKLKYDELQNSIDGHNADKMFLRNQIEELKEELKERDETIINLSVKIYQKGEENRSLSEVINTFKN